MPNGIDEGQDCGDDRDAAALQDSATTLEGFLASLEMEATLDTDLTAQMLA